MAATVVSARDVWRSYDGRSDVLQDVSLDVSAADSVIVWGANGNGKTTLPSIFGGLDIPTKGSIVIGGLEISRVKESALAKVRLHEVGFVFQTHNLIDDVTVRENVALPLRFARRPADARTTQLLEAFDLARTSFRAALILAADDAAVQGLGAPRTASRMGRSAGCPETQSLYHNGSLRRPQRPWTRRGIGWCSSWAAPGTR